MQLDNLNGEIAELRSGTISMSLTMGDEIPAALSAYHEATQSNI